MLRKRMDTPELWEYWAFVERTAAEVATWPAWKLGEPEKPKEPETSNAATTNPCATPGG
jgi:hypothetical protein